MKAFICNKINGVIPPYMFLHQFNKIMFKKEFLEYRQQMRHDVLAHLKAQPDAYVSWNYELDQFTSDAFVERLITQAQSLRDRYSNPLVIEISERAINARLDMVEITKNLQKVRDAGFKIALDDFGTEQSNVNRLMRFPIDIIKFDKSLIDDAAHDRRAQATIAALGKLAQGLDIKVIAEGVETAAQAEFLHEAELYSQQGYLHSKPLPPEQLGVQAAE